MSGVNVRPTVPGVLGNHETRIEKLEASVGGDGGIQFGGPAPIYGEQNFGEYLYVETAGAPSPVGFSMFFLALGGEMTLESDDLINLIAPQVLAQVTDSFTVRLVGATNIFEVDSVGTGPPQIVAEWQGDIKIGLQDASKAFRVQNDTGNDLSTLFGDGSATFILNDPGSFFAVTNNVAHNFFTVDANNAYIEGINVTLKITTAGGTVVVLDSGGSPIFVVNEDGSLQGKTGQSLVFNL